MCDEGSECKCRGTLLFGKRSEDLSASVLKASEYKEMQLPDGGGGECSADYMGGDPLEGVAKMCLCVPPGAAADGAAMGDPGTPAQAAEAAAPADATTVFMCGEEDDCDCHGTLLFGRRSDDLSASVLKASAFKERRADGIVKCIADEMGGDPLEGMPKMCLCLSGPVDAAADGAPFVQDGADRPKRMNGDSLQMTSAVENSILFLVLLALIVGAVRFGYKRLQQRRIEREGEALHPLNSSRHARFDSV